VSIFKGWFGELQTQFGLWLKLDKNIYKRFHNIVLETENGTTQIDHVILSKYGIFVIETKNYNGWIFGDEKQKTWTQSLYGEKYKFQNPVHQNYRHTKALSKFLNIDHNFIHSIVFFIGESKFQTKMPPNVMMTGLSKYIKNFDQVVFSDQDFFSLEQNFIKLQNKKLSNREHVSSLKERYSSSEICPKCGSSLVKKSAKKGSFAGNEFLGCSGYPKCKYIKPIE
jgi:restriction system protein